MMVSIHVDVDNLWNYEFEYGVTPSGRNDAIFDQALPLMLESFARFGVRATFFIVGKDLELSSCREFCKAAAAAGHELANHSFSHANDFYRRSYAEKESEIAKCGEALEQITNQKTVGFRAPGYYLDDELVEILIDRGYLYDTSVLPSFANALMGTFVSMKSGRSLDKVFGRKRYALTSQKITRIFSRKNPEKYLYEIPITCMPVLRMPIHSTMIYLLGERYLRIAKLCLARAKTPSVYIFHAVDTLSDNVSPELAGRLPALRWPLERRKKLLEDILAAYTAPRFVTARALAESMQQANCPRSRLFSLPMPAMR